MENSLKVEEPCPMQWLDLIHARLQNDGLFFTNGFGSSELLAESLVKKALPPAPDVRPLKGPERSRILRFESPRADILPTESRECQALVTMPERWTLDTPVLIQLPATGDEGFLARQKYVSSTLAQVGIGTILVESPYYGSRRPRDQFGTYLNAVSDLWAMGLAIVAEVRALLEWLREQGFSNLGVGGVSMGGALSCQAVALTPYPIASCACIAPHCASPVFLEGVLSKYVDWKALGDEEGRKKLRHQLDGSDLSLFPVPIRPDSAIFLPAKHDAYVDPESSLAAARCWPGSKTYWLNNGHVGTTMFHRNQYIRSIQEAFRLLKATATKTEAWLP